MTPSSPAGCVPPAIIAGARLDGLTLLEIEVIGSTLPPGRVEEAVAYAAASAGIEDGHVAIEFVDSERIAELNETWREKEGPTDVLSFPVDEDDEDLTGLPSSQRELGDVFICPEHTEDLVEAVVHGVLHLTGMDHETDNGEMLAVQAEIMGWLR
jgi:probable rRNA maturation factor